MKYDEEKVGLDYFDFELMTDPRDVAIAGAQLVEFGLERKIRARLITRDADALMKRYLGSLDAKNQMAFSTGLIEKDVFDDVHIIRKIRNISSHSAAAFSFEDNGIALDCKALGLQRSVPTWLQDRSSPQAIYKNTCTAIFRELWAPT